MENLFTFHLLPSLSQPEQKEFIWNKPSEWVKARSEKKKKKATLKSYFNHHESAKRREKMREKLYLKFIIFIPFEDLPQESKAKKIYMKLLLFDLYACYTRICQQKNISSAFPSRVSFVKYARMLKMSDEKWHDTRDRERKVNVLSVPEILSLNSSEVHHFFNFLLFFFSL